MKAIDDQPIRLARHVGEEPEFVVSTPEGRHFSVPENIYDLLSFYLEQAPTGAPPTSRVAELLKRFSTEHRTTRPVGGAGFWFRVPLASPSLVGRVAEFCQGLFQPLVWPVLLATVLVAAATAFNSSRLAHASALGPIGDVALAYVLTFLAYSMHEIGHASALRFAGAKPGSIGFTMYLIFPAFYSDVSDAWRLGRWRRLLVDVAGSYFESIAVVPLTVALVVSHEMFYWYAILMIGFSIVNNANPVFRFDGYWAIRDMFGTANVFVLPSKLARKHSDNVTRKIGSVALATLLCGIWLLYALTMVIQLSRAFVSLFRLAT